MNICQKVPFHVWHQYYKFYLSTSFDVIVDLGDVATLTVKIVYCLFKIFIYCDFGVHIRLNVFFDFINNFTSFKTFFSFLSF